MKILNMPDSRYVKKKKCYLMLKALDEYGHINWVTKVRQVLFSNGFGYIRERKNNAYFSFGYFISK